MAEEITYSVLRNRQQEEDNRPGVRRLEPGFYRRARERIETLREEYRKAHDEDPSQQRTMVLLDEVNKMEDTLEELYHLRERKIVLAAVAKARGGDPDVGNLTPAETDLFDRIVETLEASKERTLRASDAGSDAGSDAAPEEDVAASVEAADPPAEPEGPAAEAPQGTAEEDEEEAPATGATDPEQAPEGPAAEEPGPAAEDAPETADAEPGTTDEDGATGRVTVRVLEDLEPFVATDMTTYDLAEDDVVNLPIEQARVLCRRGKAVELDPADARGSA